MLNCQNITKIYGNRRLFEKFSLNFEMNKMYFIIGESGCGKSTLLNILAGLDDEYDGNVVFNNFDLRTASSFTKEEIRRNDFSYVFQNFNLLEDDSVINNIKLVADRIKFDDIENKTQRINEVIDALDIFKLKNVLVRDLSGGEKQRVAIARAILNSPKVLFCDEPTGSLDSENTNKVFELLQSLKANMIIICVSHDEEAAKKYGDMILEFQNNVIVSFENNPTSKAKKFKMQMIKKEKANKNLSLSFIFRHTIEKIKLHKFRFLIKMILSVLCFVCSGLSVTLTSSLSSSIYNSFATLIDEKSLVLTKKDSVNKIIDFYSAGESEIKLLVQDYHDYIDYYGERYIFDFENGFPDENQIFTANKGYKKKISGFNARVFNEFIYTKKLSSLETYPALTNELKDDEIIMSISFDQMKEICLDLQILRNFESLGEYLTNNDYFISLNLANEAWQYSDEQLFRVKGFIFDTKNRIYHTNSHFNKVLFEDSMMFPITYNLNKETTLPWYFRKVFYVHTKDFQDKFLNKIFYDERYEGYLFDSDQNIYSKIGKVENENTNKVFVHKIFSDYINVDIIEKLRSLKIDFESYYFSTDAGYFNNGNSIMTGFSQPAFFSLNKNDNDTVIDAYSKISQEDFLNLVLPENMIDAYALKASSDNVKIKFTKKILKLNEIEISGGFAEILNKNNSILGKELYCSLLTNSELVNDKIINNFKTANLKIVGVYEDDHSVSIYHNKDYSISLFRDLFKISTFNLIPSSIVFHMKEKMTKKEIENLNKVFGRYEFKNPLLEVEESIVDSTKFLKYILYVFSLVTLVSCLTLTFLIGYIGVVEEKREIGLIKLLGYDASEVSKIASFESVICNVVSTVVSFGLLVVLGLLINGFVTKNLGLDSFALFNPICILIVIGLGFILTLLSYLVAKKLCLKIKILDCVH